MRAAVQPFFLCVTVGLVLSLLSWGLSRLAPERRRPVVRISVLTASLLVAVLVLLPSLSTARSLAARHRAADEVHAQSAVLGLLALCGIWLGCAISTALELNRGEKQHRTTGCTGTR